MLVSLTLAFVLGRWLFGLHWPWLVITAFVVSSGGAEHADVLWRGVQRVIGAGVGTLGATLAHRRRAGRQSVDHRADLRACSGWPSWLRPINYAFWAGGVTSVLALLYGYYGERGSSLLLDRLEEIALGAAIAVTISWLVTLIPLPPGQPDPLSAAHRAGARLRQPPARIRLSAGAPAALRRLPGAGRCTATRSCAGHAIRRCRSLTDGALASGATPSGYPYALSARRR